MWINTRTKKDATLEKMRDLGGRRTTKEWAEILGLEVKDISNALYSDPELQEKYIIKVRNRKYHKMPVKEIIGKLKESGKERMTCEEMAKITGFAIEQIRSLIAKYPSIKKLYVRQMDLKDEVIISKFSEHWFGQPRFVKDWSVLTGLDTTTIRNKKNMLAEHFGREILVDKTEWRINEIKRMAGEKTLTEWSEHFEIDITAMHHFFTRKNLHHFRKNPPVK